MKSILAILLLSAALVGCQTQPIIKTEIVTVERPVPFVPKPPEIPAFVPEVDKLSDADITDPGKIGMAYKIDMMSLRAREKIYAAILEQYRASSQNFDKINAEIKAMVDEANKKMDAKAADKKSP